MSNEFLHSGRDCFEGDPPGTINAGYVLWATQLDKVRVHSAMSLSQGLRTECSSFTKDPAINIIQFGIPTEGLHSALTYLPTPWM